MIKLGMGEVIRSAFVALWRGGWPMLVCLTLWLGLELANQFWQLTYDPIGRMIAGDPASLVAEARGPGHRYLLHLPYNMATAIIGDLVSCVFIAAMLRLILIGQAGPWNLGRNGLVRSSGAVLLVSLAVTAFMKGPSWLLSVFVSGIWSGDPLHLAEIGSSLLLGLIILFFAARLCPIYPSMAVGWGWGLRRYWRRSSGNGIRLTMVFVMVLVGYFIADTILEISVFRGFHVVDPDEPFALHWTVPLRRALFVVCVSACLLTLSAVAFARLTDYPAARIPGSSKTPEQLAEAFD